MPGLRNICFTVNNPTAQLEPCTWGDKVVFCQWQLEMGEEGTLHYQGYMELKTPTTIRHLHTFSGLETAHFEARRGTREQARNYCTPNKGGNTVDSTFIEGPWEFGIFRQQGARTDLLNLHNDLVAGRSLRTISNDHFTNFIRYNRGIERWIELNRLPQVPQDYKLAQFNIPRLDLTKANLLVGDEGLGKSRFAIAHFDKPLFVRHIDALLSFQPEEFDGLVFDELNFSHFPTGARINLLDMELPAQIHCRYRHVIIPPHFPRIFCHNRDDIFYSPNDTTAERGALNRRLNIVFIARSLFASAIATTTSTTNTTATQMNAQPFSVALNHHANTLINLYTSYNDVVGSDISSPDPITFDTGFNPNDLY